MDECRCRHRARDHARANGRGRCRAWVSTGPGFNDGHTCGCTEFDDSRLPHAGERLEFGFHHLATDDAEAPAWPVTERAIARRIRKAAGLRD